MISNPIKVGNNVEKTDQLIPRLLQIISQRNISGDYAVSDCGSRNGYYFTHFGIQKGSLRGTPQGNKFHIILNGHNFNDNACIKAV